MTLNNSGSALRRTTPVWIATVLATVIASAVVAVTPTQAHATATPVPLGTAASFAVLAGSEITNTGPSVVTGDLGVSPGTAISGFPPGIVNGTVHSGPVDPVGLQAKSDLVVAYNNAAGQASDMALPPDAGGLTLVPGVYTASSTLGLTGTLTLDAQGDSSAVWVFQVGSGLTTASSSRVSLINGASPCNVFWQIGSSATLGTDTEFVGTIMALTSISLTTGADIDGRALARNGAVTMDTNVINRGTCAAGTTGGTTGGLVTGGVVAGTTTGGPTTGGTTTGGPTTGGTTTGGPTTGGTATGGLLGGVLGGATTGGANGGLLGGVLGGVTTGGGLVAGTTSGGVTGATTGGTNGGTTGGIPKPPGKPGKPEWPGHDTPPGWPEHDHHENQGGPDHGDHGRPEHGHHEGHDHGHHEGPDHGHHEGHDHGQSEPGHGDGDQSDGWDRGE